MLNFLLNRRIAVFSEQRKHSFPLILLPIPFFVRRFHIKQKKQQFAPFSCILIGLLILHAGPAPLYGANGDKLWYSDGEVVVDDTGDQLNFDACSDGSGGVFVVWQSDQIQ